MQQDHEWVDDVVVSPSKDEIILTRLQTLIYNDDAYPTETSETQKEVEESVRVLLEPYEIAEKLDAIDIERQKHIKYLREGLKGLKKGYVSLDASKPWLLYWMIHALDLLGESLTDEEKLNAIDTLNRCQNPDGGFGGGPGQIAHLATTYAAVNVVAILGIEEGYNMINREKLIDWVVSLKQPDGSFQMHEGGEVDVRGSYCAMSTTHLLNLSTPTLHSNVAEFIASCQTYEGGLGCTPGNEAHGGYTFCGLAALELVNGTGLLDVKMLTHWLVNRQMNLEGGFQGRTNKLVDSCYSFWQGGAFPILEAIFSRAPGWGENAINYLTTSLMERGGLKDKPGKYPDHYHTCYALSGLSISQHCYVWDMDSKEYVVAQDIVAKEKGGEDGEGDEDGKQVAATVVLGLPGNRVHSTHPVFNIRPIHVHKITQFFKNK
ncbi:hypothetical protein HDU76_008987 [Blyttiomyces sp. JEL0837]|nr:hypothetical protein HDU76_008987 [Blyttiomyces sp. JEL0837]